MIIFVVTSGEYSDYHIEAVFEDREQATLYTMLHPYCEIEEYDTQAVKIDARKIMYEWTARISPEGKLLFLKEQATLIPKADGIWLKDSWVHSGVYFEVVFATDRKLKQSAVEKLCYDRVAKFKAQYKGL
jgi:hypothetical protein